MQYEEVPDIKRNKQAARSAAGMKDAEGMKFALCGHVVDGDEVESSVFQVFDSAVIQGRINGRSSR